MARITQGSTIDFSLLEDQEPYKVRLKEVVGIVESVYQGKKSRRLEVTWEMADDSDVTLKDWLGVTLNPMADGRVSKLRQLLNAIAQRPKDTQVSWFDDEDYSWSYDGDTPDCTLTVGLEAVMRGESRERSDGQGKRFSITSYQSAKSEKKSRPRPRPATEDDDEAPF